MAKIICPYHDDTNASMEVYPSGGYGFCFVCWKRYKLDDIQDIPPVVAKEPEDLSGAIKVIKEFPLKEVRGLSLHANSRGYFVVWPKGEYYKFRSFSGEPRYLAPRGHSQPLFYAWTDPYPKGLLIVEGELNALSLKNWGFKNQVTVISPGPAGNFGSDKLMGLLKSWTKELTIWTDQDSAGIKALWELVPGLYTTSGRMPAVITNGKDANEILQLWGTAGIDEFMNIERKGKT